MARAVAVPGVGQEKNRGCWAFVITVPSTALSARAVKLYAPPALARDLGARVAHAREFLVSAKPRSGDDYAYRLLGLVWTEAKDDQTRAER